MSRAALPVFSSQSLFASSRQQEMFRFPTLWAQRSLTPEVTLKNRYGRLTPYALKRQDNIAQ